MTALLRTGREKPGGGGAKPPRRKGWRPSFALLAALGVIAAILVVPALRSPPRYNTARADIGYPLLVQQLIDGGLLKLSSRSGGQGTGRVMLDEARLAELIADSAQGVGPLGDCRRSPGWFGAVWNGVSGAAQSPFDACKSLFSAYARASFLREDMRVDSDTIWRRSGEKLAALAPGAHTVSDATAGIVQWTGSLDFVHPYQTLMLVDTASRKVLFRFDPRSGGPVAFAPSLRIDEGAAELSGGIAVLRAAGRDCSGNATISLLGDHALLTLVPSNAGSDCPDIWFDGEQAHSRDNALGGYRYRVMRPGQTITVGEGRPVVMQLVRSIGAVSALDEDRRRNETTLAGVGMAISAAGPDAARVTSSIIPELHFPAQRQLELLGVRELAGEVSSFRAGALLFDGLSGEVVAAPTFPITRTQLAAPDRTNSKWLDRLAINSNFQALQIGSTAKVPFATAIVQEYPKLLTLRARGPVRGEGGDFYRLLGEPLGPNGAHNEDHFGPGQPIDFTNFIAHSSNYYAMLLMKLAAGPDPLAQNGKPLDPGEAFTIDGKLHTRAPRMPADDQVWGMGWSGQLWKIACVTPYPLANRGPLAGWEERRERVGCPLAYYGGGNLARPELLYQIAHNSPALLFNRVDPRNPYPDYLMSMIGQNRSSWTNAALGQAYARILANRQVALRFDKPGPAELRTAQGFAPLGLRGEVWRAVEQGMAGAVQYGTAARLLPAIQGMEGVSVYAKTGTPTLDRRAPPGEKAEQGHAFVVAFVRYRDGRKDPANICSLRMVVVNIEDRDGDEPTPALDFVITLLGDPATARWLSGACPAARSAAS